MADQHQLDNSFIEKNFNQFVTSLHCLIVPYIRETNLASGTKEKLP